MRDSHNSICGNSEYAPTEIELFGGYRVDCLFADGTFLRVMNMPDSTPGVLAYVPGEGGKNYPSLTSFLATMIEIHGDLVDWERN